MKPISIILIDFNVVQLSITILREDNDTKIKNNSNFVL